MRFILLIIIFISSITDICGNNIPLRRISPVGGLSFTQVNKIIKDKEGYIWVVTNGNLLKYNTEEFKKYKLFDYTLNQEDPAVTLTISESGNLIVGTENGIYKYINEKDNFRKIKLNKRINLRNGASEFAPKYGDIIFFTSSESPGEVNTVTGEVVIFNFLDNCDCLFRVNEGCYFGNKDGEVYFVNNETSKYVKIIDNLGSRIRTIYSNNLSLWIGTEKNGAFKTDLSGKMLKHYSYKKQSKWDITNTSIRTIYKDINGRVWLGTYKGLYIEDSGKISHISPDNNINLPHHSIYTLYPDNENGIWIGTWSGGLAYYHPHDNRIRNYRYNNMKSAISNNIISSFIEKDTDNIYVGTEVGGLNIFNNKKETFSQIKISKNKDILNVKAIFRDNRGNLWIGTRNGAYVQKKGFKKFHHFKTGDKDGNHVTGANVYTFCQGINGVWINCYDQSPNYYNYTKNKIEYWEDIFPQKYHDINAGRVLYTDNNGRVWISESDKVAVIHKTNTIDYLNHEKLKNNSVYSFNHLSDNNIWIGTSQNGVLIVNPVTFEEENHPIQSFAKDRSVYGIIEDNNRNIWLTTNKGVVHYNKKLNNTRYITHTDGLQSNQFNPNSVYKDSNGNLYLGGTNGFSVIQQGKLNINPRPPKVLITNIEVNNQKSINYHSLKEDNSNTKLLTLKHFETSLKIDFKSDNHLIPQKNKFKYRLVNLNNKWIETSKFRSAVFTNLESGDYIFEIKSCNNDGIWNNTPKTILIHVQTAWWLRWYSLLLYILLFTGILYYIIKWTKERQRLKNDIIVEKSLRSNKEKLHDYKMKFFTNISHEFRTPLTLIINPVNKLMESSGMDKDQTEMLKVVDRNARRLLSLINELLNFRKKEVNEGSLNITSINMHEFITDRYLSFKEAAEKKKIDYNYINELETSNFDADATKLDKIIFNLLSNSFKYTPYKGKISITLSYHTPSESTFSNQLRFGKTPESEYFTITIEDSGKGIDSEDLLKVFNRFEKGKSSVEEGTGIGLSICKEYTLLHGGEIITQSTIGNGTRISVILPRKQMVHNILKNTPFKVNSENNPPLDIANSRILIIEDNNELRQYLVKLLNKKFTVLASPNAENALKILDAETIDIIISDIMMDEMSGLEFCKKIKTAIHTCHIPIVLLTALSGVENNIAGLNSGADAYITKPFDDNLLIKQVINLIHKNRKIRESFKNKIVKNETPVFKDNIDNYFLNKLNQVIETNMTNESFDVEMLTKEIGISRSQLHRKLKQMTNYSTTEYIRVQKLKKAAQYLKEGNYNVDEISYICGFGSHSYFSKCFKKLYNISPKEYK